MSALGWAAGGILRRGEPVLAWTGVVSRATGGSFPGGRGPVNVSGARGGTARHGAHRALPPPSDPAIAVTVGFVGAYTTFSTFAYESVRLGQNGADGLAALNVASSLAAGFAATWAGILAARAVL